MTNVFIYFGTDGCTYAIRIQKQEQKDKEKEKSNFIMSSAKSLAPSHDMENPNNKDGSDNERLSATLDHVLEHTCAEYAMAGVVAYAIGASIDYIALVGNPFTVAAGVNGYLIAPYTYYQ